jgi:D-arabinose 1-dehydrogenase-like Zn-dependent alcohol dehydrogenase
VHAAVVTSFDAPPSYQEFKVPTRHGADEVLVDVVASPPGSLAGGRLALHKYR